MFPTLHESTLTGLPTNNGFGVLSDCLECKISETLNGEYKLEMTYPLGGLHYEDITEGRILYALRDNTGNKQLFRIAEIETDYIARTIQIYAPHISRDLNDYAVVSESSSERTSDMWLAWFNHFDDTVGGLVAAPFTFNVDTAISTQYCGGSTVSSILEWFTTNEWAIATPPKVEFIFDNFTVTAKAARGTNSDITIRYGKNLTALKSETATETDASYYACRGYCNIDGRTYRGPFRIAGDFERTDPLKRAWKWVDFSEYVEAHASFDASDGIDTNEADDIRAKLRNAADAWNGDNYVVRRDAPTVTLDFQYLDLAKAGQYWNGPKPQELTADIGDYVTVIYGNINERSEIVSIEYDVIKERYNAITAGQIRPTLAKTIKQIVGG